MIRSADIRRMLLGHFTMPEGSSLPGERIVVCAFVIDHPGGPILFDTGIGRHEEAERIYHPVRRSLDAELARTGIGVEAVRAVVNCHLHIDHAGGNERFPGRPIFAQRAEYEAAHDWEHTNPAVVEFAGASFELHDGEATVDRGVTVVPTPGHTEGHQSLVVDTRDGPVVLAGQAFNDAAAFGRAHFALHLEQEGFPSEVPIPEWVRTIRERFDPVRVMFAHDLSVWERPEVLRP